jgi:hypothetical protein
MRSSDLVAASIAALVLLGAPRHALATPNFPGVIARELKLPGPPDCTLCHSGGQTRRGTVTTPFGTSMRSRGLVAYDEASLVKALAALTAEKKDSDQDGTPDIEELKAGTDPNAGGGPGETLPPPEYGCAIHPAGRESPFAMIFGAIALSSLVVRRRRATCNDRRRR